MVLELAQQAADHDVDIDTAYEAPAEDLQLNLVEQSNCIVKSGQQSPTHGNRTGQSKQRSVASPGSPIGPEHNKVSGANAIYKHQAREDSKSSNLDAVCEQRMRVLFEARVLRSSKRSSARVSALRNEVRYMNSVVELEDVGDVEVKPDGDVLTILGNDDCVVSGDYIGGGELLACTNNLCSRDGVEAAEVESLVRHYLCEALARAVGSVKCAGSVLALAAVESHAAMGGRANVDVNVACALFGRVNQHVSNSFLYLLLQKSCIS